MPPPGLPAPVVDGSRFQATYHEVGNGAAAVMRLPGRAEFEWSSGPIDFAALQRDMEAVWEELVAAQVPTKLALEVAQFGQAVVEAFDAAAAEQALRERTTLASALVRARAEVDSGAGDNGVTRT
jgi:hypothetical protein